MRLLRVDENGDFSLTDDLINTIPPYAILSHTWGEDHEEVNFKDLTTSTRQTKVTVSDQNYILYSQPLAFAPQSQAERS